MLLQAALVARRGSLMCCEPEAMCWHGNARACRKPALSGQHLQLGLLCIEGCSKDPWLCPSREREADFSCKHSPSLSSVAQSSV